MSQQARNDQLVAVRWYVSSVVLMLVCVVIVLLRGPARTLVIDIKYHGALHLFDEIGLIAREAEGFLDYPRGATLVPVPLHPRKLRERGYNPVLVDLSELLLGGGGIKCCTLELRGKR